MAVEKFWLAGSGNFMLPKPGATVTFQHPLVSYSAKNRPASAPSKRGIAMTSRTHVRSRPTDTAAPEVSSLQRSLDQARLDLRMDAERAQTERFGDDLKKYYEKLIEDHKHLNQATLAAHEAGWIEKVKIISSEVTLAQNSARNHELTIARVTDEAARALQEFEKQKAHWEVERREAHEALSTEIATSNDLRDKLVASAEELPRKLQDAWAVAKTEYDARLACKKKDFEERELKSAQALTERFHQEIFAAEARAQAETRRRMEAENATNEMKKVLTSLRAQLSLSETNVLDATLASLPCSPKSAPSLQAGDMGSSMGRLQAGDMGSSMEISIDARFDSWADSRPAQEEEGGLILIEERVRCVIRQKDEVIDWLKDQLAKKEEALRLASLELQVR